MGIPIGELAERISSREMTEYIAYSNLEPFGPNQNTLNAGVICSAVTGSMTGKAIDPATVFPQLDDRRHKQQQSNDEILAFMNALAVGSQLLYGKKK